MDRIFFQVIDHEGWKQLQAGLEDMEDTAEQEKRTELLDRILEDIAEYDAHVQKYEFHQTLEALCRRGIRFEPMDREPAAREWRLKFDRQVSYETKAAKRWYSSQFGWHLFSFGLLQAEMGAAADALFDAAYKEELYLFFDDSQRAFRVTNPQLLTSGDIAGLYENCDFREADMYFYDPSQDWTYVTTHESDLGPYFYRKEAEE